MSSKRLCAFTKDSLAACQAPASKKTRVVRAATFSFTLALHLKPHGSLPCGSSGAKSVLATLRVPSRQMPPGRPPTALSRLPASLDHIEIDCLCKQVGLRHPSGQTTGGDTGTVGVHLLMSGCKPIIFNGDGDVKKEVVFQFSGFKFTVK